MSRFWRKDYDWFGYCLYFVYGAVVGGLPVFIFHILAESAAMSTWHLIGWLTVCCLGGGFWFGRKHRRQWEHDNSE
jgi:hypothetical protein